jgi:predicted DNA-binding transcriptional regulator AlpA
MRYGSAMGEDDELLTARQVAAMLSVSLATFKRIRQRGEGPPSIRVGKRAIRYRRRDVERWLQRRPKK